jgi:hypothetical protein
VTSSPLERAIRRARLTLTVLALVAIVVLIVLRATVFDSSAQYGHVDIPGSGVLSLPQGRVDIFYREFVPSAQNGLFVPRAGISVRPAGRRGGFLHLVDASGGTVSINGVAHRQVLKVDVPRAGPYLVRTSGAIGHDAPQFLFGRSTSIVPVLIWGGVGLVVLWVLSFLGLALVRGRGSGSVAEAGVPAVEGLPAGGGQARTTVVSGGASQAPDSAVPWTPRPAVSDAARAPSDPLDELAKLGDLHQRGVLTDAEFEAEKAKLLREV